jgi:general secretion pathway protein C
MGKLGLIKTVVILAALGSVAAAAAPLFWRLRGHDTIIPPTVNLRTQPDAAPRVIDVGPVLVLTPFGAPPVQDSDTSEDVAEPLKLTLLGVIVRDDPARSLALIGSPEGKANYQVGDVVTAAATLTDVTADYVIIDENGESHRLGFDGLQIADDADTIPTGEDRLAAIMAFGQGTTISERNDAASRRDPVTTQDYIDMWRDRIDANPAAVLDAIGLVSSENGYTVAQEHDSGVSRAGLKAGDIVTSLNGQPLGDIDSDRALYDQVAQSGMARIEIERNGRTIVMSFPLQ